MARTRRLRYGGLAFVFVGFLVFAVVFFALVQARIVLIAGFVDSQEHEAGPGDGIPEVSEGSMVQADTRSDPLANPGPALVHPRRR